MMKRLPWVLLALCGAAAVGWAGPNEGGVLWVHDTGIVFSTDTVQPIVSAPPADCAGVDNEQPLDGVKRVWKVYAAFPAGSSPRLKATAWAIEFPESPADPYVSIDGAGCGLPNEDGPGTDFAIVDLGFPAASGGQIGQSFPWARLTKVVQLYYFTGFAYASSKSSVSPAFAAAPHSVPFNRVFLDDATPQNADPIMGYGSLGFGQPGTTPCPNGNPDAACCAPDGTCTLTKQADCPAGSVWHSNWYLCDPNPCPPPTGACCYTNGLCLIAGISQCLQGGGIYMGNFVPCSPNPCPTAAACCNETTGSCLVRIQAACLALPGFVWHPEWPSCAPNPCPAPPPNGTCCLPSGTCLMTTQAACGGAWTEGGYCLPNPCPQPPPTGSFGLDLPASGYPGDLIPVVVTGVNSVPLLGYGLSFTFDPSVFEFVSSTLAGTRGVGAFSFIPGSTPSSARAGVIYGFSCAYSIPAGSGPMLMVTLRVKPGAPAGVTSLILEDRPPALNRMTVCDGGTLAPDLSGHSFEVLPQTGACCFRNAYCRILPQARCVALRGVFVGGVCTPSVNPPCYVPGGPRGSGAPPVDDTQKEQRSSWGQIKGHFRP
jgi:hypothetical protein